MKEILRGMIKRKESAIASKHSVQLEGPPSRLGKGTVLAGLRGSPQFLFGYDGADSMPRFTI